MRRDLRAVVGAAQDPDLWHRRSLRLGADAAEWMALDQRPAGRPGDYVTYLGGEVVRGGVGGGIEREGGQPVGARGAAEAEIDPPGGDCLKHAELLGDFQAG